MAMHNKVQGYEDTAPFQQPAVHKSLLLSSLHDDLYLITSNHTRPDPKLCPLGETPDHIISSLNLFRSVQFDTNLEGIHHQPKSHCVIRRKTRVQMVASTCQVSAKQHCCLSFRYYWTGHYVSLC
ncbi:unnamed protein product [Brassica oleracea var. botrytis]